MTNIFDATMITDSLRKFWTRKGQKIGYVHTNYFDSMTLTSFRSSTGTGGWCYTDWRIEQTTHDDDTTKVTLRLKMKGGQRWHTITEELWATEALETENTERLAFMCGRRVYQMMRKANVTEKSI